MTDPTHMLRRALFDMRSDVVNIIGFHDLIYEPQRELTSLQRLTYETHLAASSHNLAVAMVKLINLLSDERGKEF